LVVKKGQRSSAHQLTNLLVMLLYLQYLSLRGTTSLQPKGVEMELLAIHIVYLCCVPSLNHWWEGIRA